MFSLTILLIPVGLVAGVLAGLLGIGGGLVIVPILTLLLIETGQAPEVALPTAIATSLGSMLMTAVGSVLSHAKKLTFDTQTLVKLAPGVMVGALAGAWLVTQLPVGYLAGLFAVLVTAIGIRMILGLQPDVSRTQPQLKGVLWTGPAMGVVSALMGIGGGSMVVPYLIWNGYRPVAAVAVASATGWLLAASGTLGFWLTEPGYLNIGYIAIIGVSGFVAAPVGAALAHRLSPTRLQGLFGLMLMAVAFRMLWQIYSAT